MFAGLPASSGAVINTSGQRCFVSIICKRYGPGLFGGLGITVSPSISAGDQFADHTSHGLFLELGSGPGGGGSLSIGGGGATGARAFGGLAGGFAVGYQKCHVQYVCENPLACPPEN